MAAFPLPAVQGFNFQEDGRIPNIDKLKTSPSSKDWNELLECVLSDGDKLFSTTNRGSNHPVQTQTLRVDYQGVARDKTCANQQAQLGGVDNYQSKKNESTSISCVHVDFKCDGHTNIKNALKQAHDYSFKTGNVVIVTLAPAAATVVPAVASTTNPSTTNCPHCSATQNIPAWIKSKQNMYCEDCGTSFAVP